MDDGTCGANPSLTIREVRCMIFSQGKAMKTHLNRERSFSFSSYYYYPSFRREARAPGEGQAA